MSSQQPLWRAGQTIADLYEVREVNTEGGMAIAYFVWHTTWRLELVIKSPRPELLAERSARDQFTHEAETWVNLGLHPNIVTAYYVRQIEEFPRIIIEKMNGGSLKQWLAAGKVKDLATALDIAIQIASGLAYAQKHEPGFVHRDIKPANVLMTPYGEAKVTDFGLVGAVGARVGTPAYMSPEVWTDPTNVTPAADLYSFGVMLYEILTGRRPFERMDAGTSLGEIRGGRGAEGSVGGLRELELDAPVEQSQLSIGERRDIERMSDRSVGEMTALTNLRAISEDDLAFYFLSHTKEAPEAPSRFNATIGEELDGLCLSLLEKEATARPTSVEEVTERLRAIHEQCVGQPYLRKESRQVELLADSLNNRALSYMDLGKEREAVQCWRQASTANPTHFETTFNLGYWEWNQGIIDDLEYLKKLVEIEERQRTNPQYWRALMSVHLDCGNRQEAQRSLEVAKSLDTTISEDLPPIPSFRHRHTLELPTGVHSVACSPNGDYALSAGMSNVLLLFDLRSLRCVGQLNPGPAYDLHTVVFWPDGNFAFSGTHGSDIRLWDVYSGDCLAILKDSGYSDTPAETASSLAISKDGKLLASAYRFGMWIGKMQPIRIWDLKSGDCAKTLEGHINSVYSIALTDDGKYLLSGGPGVEDEALKLWEIESGRCYKIFEGQTGSVCSVAISPVESLAASGGSESTVKLWSIDSGECLKTLRGHTGTVYCVKFSPGGDFVISGGEDKTIKVWDARSGKCIRTLEGHNDSVYSVVFRPNGGELISGSSDKTIRLWEICGPATQYFRNILSIPRATSELMERQERVALMLNDADNFIQAGFYARAYQLLRMAQATPGYDMAPEISDRIYFSARQAVRTGFRTVHLARNFEEHSSGVSSVNFSHDAKRIVSGSRDGTIKIWEVVSGSRVGKLEGHKLPVSSVCFSSDGKHILSGSRANNITWKGKDKTLKLWEVGSERCVNTFGDHRTGVSSVAFARDGSFIVTGAREVSPMPDDNVVRIWRLGRRLSETVLAGHSDVIEAVAVSSDCKRILSGSRDKTIILWDVDSREPLAALEGHSGAVYAVAFSPDGQYALSGGGDDVMKLWELSSGRCARTFVGHRETVFAVAFSPDGKFATSGSDDKHVRLWEVGSGDCLRILEGHTDGVTSVAFSPDGRYIASGGYDMCVKLWEFDWEWHF